MTGGVMILAALFAHLKELFWGDSNYWTVFGLVGNIMFTSRFVVQWYASEKLKQSIIPKNFWHLSLLGGLINLVYAVHVPLHPRFAAAAGHRRTELGADRPPSTARRAGRRSADAR